MPETKIDNDAAVKTGEDILLMAALVNDEWAGPLRAKGFPNLAKHHAALEEAARGLAHVVKMEIRGPERVKALLTLEALLPTKEG